MNAQIRIVTRSEGNRTEVRYPADRTFEEGGFFVRYNQDADRVLLRIFPDKFYMEREGDTGLRAEFVRGVRTSFIFSIGDGETSVPLDTLRYEALFGDRISIQLFYRLFFGEKVQLFDLEILISKATEAQ